MPNILAVCLSATIQKTVSFDSVELTKVNRSKNYRLDASGKAVNTSRVLTQINPECCYTICPLGEKNADLFLDLAERDNIYVDFVTIPGFTRECLTLLDRTANTTTEIVVGEPDIKVSCQKQEKEILKKIKEQLSYADAVLLAGSKPSIWSDDLYAKIAEMTLNKGVIFLADYVGKDMEETLKRCTPTIIKINDEEFEKTFGMAATKENITEKSRELNNIIVVTRGTESTYAAKRGEFAECPVEKLTPVNTTACGDSFNAGFLYEYSVSGDFEEALNEGTWCAARNAECECPGSLWTKVNESLK